jgi:predicted RNA-binding protein YlqC (UPF0109 family)
VTDAAVEQAPNKGAAPQAVLQYLAEQIVDDRDSIRIDVESGPGGVILRLRVAPDDMGKVIGKRGRVAQSIRTLVRAAAAREGIGVTVDIVD